MIAKHPKTHKAETVQHRLYHPFMKRNFVVQNHKKKVFVFAFAERLLCAANQQWSFNGSVSNIKLLKSTFLITS
jgi:hypothetical protein